MVKATCPPEDVSWALGALGPRRMWARETTWRRPPPVVLTLTVQNTVKGHSCSHFKA